MTIDVASAQVVTCTFTNLLAMQPGGIGDFVWNDANRNGIQDRGEKGVAGVRINLYTAGGAVLASPDSAGAAVQASSPGHPVRNDPHRRDRHVHVRQRPGRQLRRRVHGTPGWLPVHEAIRRSTNTIDSDADLTTGRTPVMVIPQGYVDLTCDAGIYLLLQPAR